MREYLQFYIDGRWVDPAHPRTAEVVNPATEAVSGTISLGSAADVELAVAAARRAFASWSLTTREQRLDLLRAIQAEYARRQPELGEAITEEMGAPASLANGFHVGLGAGHLQTAIEILKDYRFEEQRGATMIAREPIGVCALITPWNWPMNQTCVKIFPALATGCTMILKPPQLAPYSAQILAEILDAAGVPAGVFNMIQGAGSVIGTALSTHPDVDMVSFTGSEPVGVQISRDAAQTVKRVGLELGGKSPFIVLDDDDLTANVTGATAGMMGNSGQTCSAGRCGGSTTGDAVIGGDVDATSSNPCPTGQVLYYGKCKPIGTTDTGSTSSSGCQAGAGNGGFAGLLPFALALLALGVRRRTGRRPA